MERRKLVLSAALSDLCASIGDREIVICPFREAEVQTKVIPKYGFAADLSGVFDMVARISESYLCMAAKNRFPVAQRLLATFPDEDGEHLPRMSEECHGFARLIACLVQVWPQRMGD